MRILLLANKSPWPPRDGGSAATLGMINGLHSCGVSVKVLALNPGKHFADPKELSDQLPKNLDLSLIPINTAINPLLLSLNLLFSDKPYPYLRFKSEDFIKELLSVPSGKFDFIQFEGLAMTFYLPYCKNFSGTKFIYRPHNVESTIWRQLSDTEGSALKRYYFRNVALRCERMEREILNSFDGIAAVTSLDLDHFKRAGLSKPSTVCPAGFNLEKSELHQGDDHTLCFIGALDWLPNINGLKWFIKEVWPIVAAKDTGATFHIAGRNPSSSIKKVCTGHNIYFHGEVESSEEFIKNKQVMVAPLFAGSGLRMKIIEGMSMGKSIVATPVAALGIEHKNGRDIHIRSDAAGFADCIVDLLRNPKLRNETTLFALENVRKNYNIFVAAENLIKFYSRLT